MITLRQDQAQLKSDIYAGWNSGARNVLAVLPTGGGKSVIVSDIVNDGNLLGMQQTVIAHRTELVGQMSLHVGRRGIKHRIIGPSKVVSQIMAEHRREFNGYSFINPTANCSVAGIDTLIARSNDLKSWAEQQDRWIIDECFPSGTLIETDKGRLPIETIRKGHKVLSFDQISKSFVYRKVLNTFKNPMPCIMFDILINGQHIRCTAGHPFWTKRGWIEAKDLKKDDDLFIQMHGMRNRVRNRKRASILSIQKNRKRFLHKKMRNDLSRCETQTTHKETYQSQNMFGLHESAFSNGEDLFSGMRVCDSIGDYDKNQFATCFEKNENKKSYACCGNSQKNADDIEVNWSQANRARRQWRNYSCSRISSKNNVGTNGIYSSVFDKNRNEEKQRISNVLPSRHIASNIKNSNRSGRGFAFDKSKKNVGREERYDFEWFRVENIKIYKPSNHGRNTIRFVYNIEVEEHHTYVANGIVVHNCHHVLRQNKWGAGVALFPRAYGLGVTASPSRADGMGLGSHHDGVFDLMCVGPDMRQLIEMGALTDYEIVIPESDFHIDDSEVAPSGDFSPKKMRDASKRSHIVGDVVKEYFKYAYGKRGITFATDVETSNEIAQRFNDCGVPTASISAKTPSEVRNEYIRRFRSGQLWMLVNVDLFGEGFDVPAVEVVIMARPTASLSVYLQQFGRALRTLNGKLYGLIIDHVSNWKRHGFPDKKHFWTLDRRDKRGKREADPELIELTRCKSCARPYEKVLFKCPHCGQVPELTPQQRMSIETIDGDLILLDREELARRRAAIEIESPASVGNRVAHVAGDFAGKGAANNQIEKIQAQSRLKDAIAQWAAIERSKGRDDQQTYRRFFLTTGVDVLGALDATRSRKDYETLAATVEGWYING